MPTLYAVLNLTTMEFCGINYREAWKAQSAAEMAATMYRDASNDEFVVVAVSPIV